MNRKIILGIAFLIIIGGAISLSVYLINQKELPPQRPKPEIKNYVKAIPVAYKPAQLYIETFGRVGSSQQVNLIAEVGGKLEPGSISFKEGTNFSRGNLLAKINNDEQRLNLQSRKSSFLNLVATILPDLRIDFPDIFPSWERYYAEIDLDKDLPELPAIGSAKAKAFLSTANILSEYYTIKSLEENLKKYNLYAPYNGSIQSVNVEIGSVVNPGTTIASIIRTDRLELKVPVELQDIDQVSIGTDVTIYQEGRDDKRWTGEIVRKADFVDPNNQSVNVYIAINSPENDVYDGMYLKAVIPGKEIKEGMSVARAIVKNKNEVFVVEDGVLRTKTINIAQIDQNEIIFNGLPAGEMLVVDAPTNASDNMKVEIVKN